MNKLEKILAQSVTPEMVAEQLTEQEIEEVIEEYELKVEEAEQSIERAEHKEKGSLKMVERYQKSADDWKEVVEEEKEKLKTWQSVVEKAKQALRETKEKSGTFRKGYMLLRDYNDAKKKSTPNKRRAELIDEAKRFVKNYEEDLGVRVHKEEREVYVESADFVTHYKYPKKLVWNERVATAYSIAKTLYDFFGYEEMKEASIRFGEDAPQPAEIVEGMDVEFFSASRSLYKRGRVKEYNEKDDYVILEDGYELGEDAKPNNVVLIASSNYRILSDTKAKYSDGDE